MTQTPTDLAVDPIGNFYLADRMDQRVRKRNRDVFHGAPANPPPP